MRNAVEVERREEQTSSRACAITIAIRDPRSAIRDPRSAIRDYIVLLRA